MRARRSGRRTRSRVRSRCRGRRGTANPAGTPAPRHGPTRPCRPRSRLSRSLHGPPSGSLDPRSAGGSACTVSWRPHEQALRGVGALRGQRQHRAPAPPGGRFVVSRDTWSSVRTPSTISGFFAVIACSLGMSASIEGPDGVDRHLDRAQARHIERPLGEAAVRVGVEHVEVEGIHDGGQRRAAGTPGRSGTTGSPRSLPAAGSSCRGSRGRTGCSTRRPASGAPSSWTRAQWMYRSVI